PAGQYRNADHARGQHTSTDLYRGTTADSRPPARRFVHRWPSRRVGNTHAYHASSHTRPIRITPSGTCIHTIRMAPVIACVWETTTTPTVASSGRSGPRAIHLRR